MENKKELGLTEKVELARFEVLKKLQEGFTVTEIAKYRNVSRNAIYKILKTLLNKGLIQNTEQGNYRLTLSGIEGLHSFVQLRYCLRQHNLHFKIKILESPKNWEKRRHAITQLPYFNKKIKLRNNEQELFNFGKVQLRTTSKSVIVKIPTIYSKTTEEAVIQSFDCLYEIIPKIENLFKVRLIKDYKANITIISQEYASLNDTLAKIYQKEGNQLIVTDDEGKIWMITDFSFSNDETEFIDSNKAIDDTDAVLPMLNDLRKNPTTFSEVRENLNIISNQILQVTNNQLVHAENMVSHVGAVQDLGKGVNELRETIKQLTNEITRLKETKI